MATTLKEDKKSFEIIARVISTETSEVLDVKDVFTEDKGLASAKELMDGLAAKLARGFPILEGMVVKSSGNDIYCDLGKDVPNHKGTSVIIYRKGPEIKHPVTGKSLGFESIKLAEAHVDEIYEGYSKVKIKDSYKKQVIKPMDLIISK